MLDSVSDCIFGKFGYLLAFFATFREDLVNGLPDFGLDSSRYCSWGPFLGFVTGDRSWRPFLGAVPEIVIIVCCFCFFQEQLIMQYLTLPLWPFGWPILWNCFILLFLGGGWGTLSEGGGHFQRNPFVRPFLILIFNFH